MKSHWLDWPLFIAGIVFDWLMLALIAGFVLLNLVLIVWSQS